MDESFVLAASDRTRLAGTLTRPTRDGRAPAALLISGSGSLDRDSNTPGQTLDVASALATALAAQGVASLRYDKRGVGESGGDYLSTGFDQETVDACDALRELGRASGIDGDRLVVIGHSVGAMIAIRLARSNRQLAGTVLLCPSSRKGAEVMRRQSERIAGTLRGPARLCSRRFLRRQQRDRRRLLASTGDTARIGRSDAPARWFREYMAYDPSADLRAIRCPVLAVTGREDVQVDPGDIERIGQLVTVPFAGHTPAGLTHVLRCHPGPAGLASYPAQLEEPVDAELLELVAAWTRARFEEPGRSTPARLDPCRRRR